MAWLIRRHWPEETIVALIDGELDAAEREAVEHHMDRCQRCSDLLAHQARAQQALVASFVPAPALTNVTAAPSDGHIPLWLPAAGAVAGACSGLLVMGVLLYRRQRSAASGAPRAA